MGVTHKQLHILGEMVEKILFDEKELGELKDLITAVRTQKVPARKLKERILETRGSMVSRILQLFPVYNKSLSNHKEIETFGNGNAEMTKELEEKNSLLEQVGTKLQELEVRLQKESVP
jgi:hypothetical protein